MILLLLANVRSVCLSIDANYNTTHPDHGMVSVSVDFSQISESVDIPDRYFINIDGEEYEATSTTLSLDVLFIPGEYTICAYNKPKGMTVDDGIVSVLPNSDGTIDPVLDYFFSACERLIITSDTDHKITISSVRTQPTHRAYCCRR